MQLTPQRLRRQMPMRRRFYLQCTEPPIASRGHGSVRSWSSTAQSHMIRTVRKSQTTRFGRQARILSTRRSSRHGNMDRPSMLPGSCSIPGDTKTANISQ